jgi:hypothetical protein
MLRGIALLIAVVLAVLAALWVFQRRLIYLPDRSSPSPGSAALEEVRFATDDGLELVAWFVPAVGDSKGSVLMFNGNAGNRSDRLPLGEALARKGYATLLVDYRGYGGNPGSPSEDGLAADARAALEYLRSRVDPLRIAYFGESLGTGVAVHLATEHPPRGLILRSPFTSLADVASAHYPIIPTGLLLRDQFDNEEKIGNIAAPLLVIAGAEDRIVPTELSVDLYETANEPKELVVIEGVGHNDAALLDGAEMIAEVVVFLEAALGPTDPRP